MIAELARVNLVLQGIDLVEYLVGADDLLLKLHVAGLAVDEHDLEVLDVLRNGVHQVGYFLLAGRHLVKLLHDFGLQAF